MTVDVERLRRELWFVTTHPERWEQDLWYCTPAGTAAIEPAADRTCGTTACLAGWTLLHAGYLPYLDGSGWMITSTMMIAPGTGPATDRLVNVREAARGRLGLSDDQADLLFDVYCNLRDLWEFARVFTGGAIEVPAAVTAEPPVVFDPVDEEYYAGL